MPAVVSRWQLVLSKNFAPARYVMLAPPHGACARSSVMVMLPWLVMNVRSRAPEAGKPSAGGRPVLVTAGLACGVEAPEVTPCVAPETGLGPIGACSPPCRLKANPTNT